MLPPPVPGLLHRLLLLHRPRAALAGGRERLEIWRKNSLMFPLQLLIVAVFDIFATIGFVKVELASKR